ncbi:adenylosuccinate lyase [Candidatus Falkowbacteria bacterium]|nr:adenylosuccinate lyase [Candidatus Falkowbacteria bacterium]
MIDRYTLKEMAEIWLEQAKKGRWHEVELAVLWAKVFLKLIPQEALAAQAVKVTPELLLRADEIEATTDHDLIAFILTVAEQLPEAAKPHYHTGMTSYDDEDTALATIMIQSLGLILEKLGRLKCVIWQRAQEHKMTVMIGRTHGIHAEPITFGLKLLVWLDDLDRHEKHLEYVREVVRVGKVSGAVGTYPLDPKIEEVACEHLGLKPARISNQVISRAIHFHYVFALVAVANSLDKFATEVRNLARTDIGEVAEFKKSGAKGSSAMPGKSRLRNPIKSENVCSLAKMMRGYLIPAAESEVLWHERTLDNSAAERIYLPDASILLHFMLDRFANVIEKLEVYPEQMRHNLNKTGGIVFAQRVMQALTEKGMARDEAYNLMEGLALAVKPGTFTNDDGHTFQDLVYANSEVGIRLSANEREKCFDWHESLKYVDVVFRRFEPLFENSVVDDLFSAQKPEKTLGE